MSKNKKIVPALRFPEFENNAKWTENRLTDFNSLESGDGDWILSKNISSNGEYDIVQLSSIGFGRFKEKKLKTITNETFDELNGTPIQKGDILINRMVDSDKINSCIFPHDGKYVTSVDVCWIRQNKFFNNYFLMILLCTGSNQKNLLSLSSGAGRVRISKKNLFERFVFLFPQNPKEQQKIADCLSSLDELITAHSDKLETLKNHKKGLMQNLFPQEGQKAPNYRFPEFKDDGVWIPKPIEEVFSIFQGYAFSSKDSVSSGTRWLKIADVGIQEMKHNTPSYLPIEFKKEHQRFLLKKGDYVLALTRPILSGKLKIAPVDEIYHNSLLNQRVGKLVTSNIVSFIYYLLQTSSMVDNISRNIAGNEPPNLSFQQISDIKVFIPKEKTEQKKIASCLSALDASITAQTDKIEQLQQHKKGLMQGLFPKIEN